MTIKSKKDLFIWLGMIYFCPAIITFAAFMNKDFDKISIIIITITWLLCTLLAIYFIIDYRKPYKFFYLLDYETFINYMKEEEKFCVDNNLEAGFHYYLYQNNIRVEVQAWYHGFSNINEEQQKGTIYYWNKEECNVPLENFIESKINKNNNLILIELIDSDSITLNKFKDSHKELDIGKYIIENNILIEKQ